MPAITSIVIIGTITVMDAIVFVATIALSYVISSLTQPDGLRGTSQQDPGVRSQVPPDTTNPMPVVYGDAYIGARFVDAVIQTNQAAMFYVQAISCVSTNGQFSFDTTKFYYGDRLITFSDTEPYRVVSLTDGAGNVDTSINASAGLLKIWLYTSSPSGVITPLNSSWMPWDENVMGNINIPEDLRWSPTGRNMNGLAFAVIYLEYSRDAGTTQLQTLTYHCSHYLYDQGCAKPGDVISDYLTNPQYGGAIPAEFCDVDSFIALNNYSDELITFNDYEGNPQTQPRYRINGVIDTGKNVLKNIDDIMIACDSWLRYEPATGFWSVTINQAGVPALALNDNNIIGSLVVGTTDITQSANIVEAKFPDSTNRDQYNYVNEAVPPDLLYPNEPINKQTLTYELVNNSVQALYLANRVLEQGREDLTVTVNTTYVGIQLSAGDIVSITNAAYGWDAKLFRCMQVQESVSQDNSLGAQLQLIEYNAQVYDNFDITQFAPAGNTGNPSSGYFSPLTAPSVVDPKPYDKIPTFKVNCAIPTTGRTTAITLYWTTSATPSSTDWNALLTQTLPDSQPFAPDSVVTFTCTAFDANTYYFAFKVINDTYSSQSSPTSTPFSWNPDPANASSFTLTFNPATMQVPYSGGSPNFAGVTCKLYGQNGLGGVDFVPAQDDADVTFVNGTWRIGNSDTTGYTDIVETGISVPDPTDGGTHADFGQPTAMPSATATMQVPVRYKDLAGVVHQVSPASIQYAYATAGASASKYATGYLYQWNTTTPGDPNGNSLYTWSTGAMSSYTGTNGWSTSIPSNPGVPLIQLWQASKQIVAAATDTTTTVDWTSGFSVSNVTQNGSAGTQTANPTVYQWAITIPSGPTGTSTYTWATTSFTPTPSGWNLTPGTSPSPGYTLWGATVPLVDSATATTTSINWTTASITARGYSGAAGSSARICYASTSASSLNSTPTTYTTSGGTSYPPTNTWGGSETWVATPPSISAGQSVWQSDGIYDPTANQTVWNVPYLSNLKVGSLSAISANLGTITAGSITGVTITGGTLQTSTSGQRIVIDGATNMLTAYNSSGTTTASIGGSTGNIYANTSLIPAVYGQQNNASFPSGYFNNQLGDAINGTSQFSGIGVFGLALTGAYTGTSTNHGVRGTNQNGAGAGVNTSGLIGMSAGYDFYAEGGGTNYGPFTGAHDVVVQTGANIPVGSIVYDIKCVVRKNISNTIFEVAETTTANQVPIGVLVVNNGLLANSQPAAFVDYMETTEVDGIYITTNVMTAEYEATKDIYDYCLINAVGEGQVLVNGENGNIAAGDLIVTSSTAGVGMKQSDSIVRNTTVAKAREAVTFTDTTTPVLVACIYLCG